MYDSNPLIQGNIIHDNYATYEGGGILCRESNPTIIYNTISDNYTQYDHDDNRPAYHGGGIFCDDGSSPKISYNDIFGNFSEWGGGICCRDYSNPIITHNNINFNEVSYAGGGGGLNLHGCSPVVSYNVISWNHAYTGGGLLLSGSILVDHNIITGNYGSYGGAVYVGYMGGTVLHNNLIYDNSATVGPGICSWWPFNFSVTSCTIYGNVRLMYDPEPGGIWGFGTVRDCIIWGNSDPQVSEGLDITYSNVQRSGVQGLPVYPGEGNINEDPLFIAGPMGNFYLSQIAAGQPVQSPCVDAGDPFSAIFEGTTRIDHIQDTGVIDMGFHYCNSLAGSISGTVTDLSTYTPFAGVAVNLYDGNGELVYSVMTSDDGSYEFAYLESGEYLVDLILPIAFETAQDTFHVTLPPGYDAVRDFGISDINIVNEPRAMNYWRRQVKAAIRGTGNYDYTVSQLEGFAQDIYDHFYSNPSYPIVVEGVTYMGSPAVPLDISALDEMLTINQGGSSMYDRARQHFMATMLNVASWKLDQQSEATEDGATVSQTILHIGGVDGIIGTDDALAISIARTLNKGRLVDAGIIPLSTPSVIYGDELEALSQIPEEFKCNPAYPNPFNPATAISFTLPEVSHVRLSIYNIQGRKVDELVNGMRDAGYHEVTWDATGVPSGIYFYQIEAGDYSAVRKMVLVK